LIAQAAEGLAHNVIGAAIEVHRELGPGYLERVYEEALAYELQLRGIPFERQVPVKLVYKDLELGAVRLDFLVGNLLIVELKTAEAIIPAHVGQVIRYLKVMNLNLGLLLNFDVARMQTGIRRVVYAPNPL
jgi:GxxExxY protein